METSYFGLRNTGSSFGAYTTISGKENLISDIVPARNAESVKMGRKDIIKISKDMDIDFDVLGYIDPGITVSTIRGGEVVERRKMALPERVIGVLKCKNPRCITSVEQELTQEFKLTDPERQVYRCIYCDQKASK